MTYSIGGGSYGSTFRCAGQLGGDATIAANGLRNGAPNVAFLELPASPQLAPNRQNTVIERASEGRRRTPHVCAKIAHRDLDPPGRRLIWASAFGDNCRTADFFVGAKVLRTAMRLDDLKISAKVMLPAIVLALVALASVAMGTWQASRIEKSQEILVEERAPTELAVARFSRQVATIGYSAYRAVANDGASQNAHQASEALDEAFRKGNGYLDKAMAADPSSAAEIMGLKTRFKTIHDSARQGADMGLQNIDEAAVAMMDSIDPQMVALTKDTAAWIDRHNAETEVLVTRSKREAARSSLITITFGLLSAAAALAYALWIGSRKIAKPLVGLSKTMEVLAQGSVDVEVAGAQRKDEVGAMARSVQVFKDNALALRTAEAAQQRA
ncbi:HAMP domain-containing protein, partial [Caulobacter sp. Root1472]|uniref:HAMP domain-containing protein n=1 Tax=Caulobacter sp. Root1472 TaxID=1736470 RepID=UPI0012E3C9FF